MSTSDEGHASTSSKSAAIIGVFVASLVAAYLPSASDKLAALRLPERTFFYAKHFGAGVISSTAFVHLLGAAFERLESARWLGYKHWPGLLVMTSLIVIFLMEYATGAYLEANTTAEDTLSISSVSDSLPKFRDASSERSPLLGNFALEGSENKLIRKRRQRIVGVIILQVGIMLHSFVIGVTMAVASPERFASLVPAIMFHQVFEGLALGVRLASLTTSPDSPAGTPIDPERATIDTLEVNPDQRPISTPSSSTLGGDDAIRASLSRSRSPSTPSRRSFPYIPSRTESLLPPVLAVLFAIPIPLMLVISIFIPSLQTHSQLTPNTISADAGSLSHSHFLQGVTSAISAGLLIYVACVELIAGDFVDNVEIKRLKPSIQLGAIIAFVAGAAGMSLL